MRERFAGFGGPAVPFLAELDGAEVLFTAVEEVSLPLPWHRGRVVLIGDAAHASTPFMGQGGAMALADAVALGQVLRPGADIDAALTAFGEARFPVCTFVQDASRAVGEAGAREEASGLAARNVRLAAGAQAAVDGFYARLAELNAAAEARLRA
jgi:2-polyprenyl-6-methoxyphenol hydroxylase-like FAD-dependent oxidoreductase